MKRAILFLLALLFCLPAVSCGKQPEPTAEPGGTADTVTDGTTDAPKPTAAPGQILHYADVYDPETDCDNRYNRSEVVMLESEDAFYFGGAYDLYLYYYDKTGDVSGVLCAKPECIHDEQHFNSSCSGYLDADGRGIAYCGGKIYYKRYSAGHTILMRMDQDGSNREKVLTMEVEYQYIPDRICIHRGKLFGECGLQTVTDAAPNNTCSIACWDLETGEYKLIYEENFLPVTVRPYMFFFGDYVYIFEAYSLHPGSEDPYADQKIKLLRWDMNTEELTTVFDITDPCFRGILVPVWVEAEDEVYTVGVSYPDGLPIIYRISYGEFSEVLCFERPGFPALLQGGSLNYTTFDILDDEDRFGAYVQIVDYDGNELYNGELPLDQLPELLDRNGEYDIGISGIFGSTDRFFFSINLNHVDAEGHDVTSSCLIEYDLVDGQLESKLLMIAKWD